VQFKTGLDHSVALSGAEKKKNVLLVRLQARADFKGIANGDVYGWGLHHEGQLGLQLGEEDLCSTPTVIPNIPAMISIDCGFDHSVFVDRSSLAYV
jgi:alpha-tubulin suppressor-like RCC1 family protein